MVDDLGFSVGAGQIVGFLGPNGAGKTTTIRMLLGLSSITAGTASLLGSDVASGPMPTASVGAMVEEPAFYPWMTGRRNLEVLLQGGAGAPPGSIERAMDRAGIAHAARRRVKEYSQGMRQRLGLAAAIMRLPKVLILDEPANGLDPQGIRELRELVRALADEGAAVLLSSHQLGEVEQVCDRILIIKQGRLLVQGDTESILSQDARIRVQVPRHQGESARVALSSFATEDVGGGSFLVKAPAGRLVSEVLARSGIYPDEVALERRSLEERFFQVTDEGAVA